MLYLSTSSATLVSQESTTVTRTVTLTLASCKKVLEHLRIHKTWTTLCTHSDGIVEYVKTTEKHQRKVVLAHQRFG
jgi:hypothetical protein